MAAEEPKPITLVETARLFAKQLGAPLTRELLQTAYEVAKLYAYTPMYVLEEAIQHATAQGLLENCRCTHSRLQHRNEDGGEMAGSGCLWCECPTFSPVASKPKSGTPEAAQLAIGMLVRGMGNPAVCGDANTTMEQAIVNLALRRMDHVAAVAGKTVLTGPFSV